MSKASRTDVVILGAAGDAAVIASSIENSTQWNLLGVLDDRLAKGTPAFGVEVLGSLDFWGRLPETTHFISALHKVKQMSLRADRINSLQISESQWATVIDNAARICKSSSIGYGTYLGPFSVVQPGARIGRHVSIRAGANIGHDAEIGDYCYLGPNSTLCGTARMEDGSHLGPNACIVDGQVLGEFAVVGASSAVTKSLPAYGIYFGVPAARIGTIKK